MPSANNHPPIVFRPPEEDRAHLLAYAEAAGRPVNAILPKRSANTSGKCAMPTMETLRPRLHSPERARRRW